MSIDKLRELKFLYESQSKHSQYQNLPTRLATLLNLGVEKTRFEAERLKFILQKLETNGKSVLDIGGNTGYFTFEFLDCGAKFVHYYEGNKIHADFVRLAALVLNVENKIEITNKYYSFENEGINTYDIVLLLNILHHYGDDYGTSKITIEKAKQEILIQLNSMAEFSKWLVFQMGFNWKGDKNLGLFKNGTKSELICYIRKGIENNWEIVHIGIPEILNGRVNYCEMNNDNIVRNDAIGEFLNRPLFILKSKHV